jgi:hypothetical protein
MSGTGPRPTPVAPAATHVDPGHQTPTGRAWIGRVWPRRRARPRRPRRRPSPDASVRPIRRTSIRGHTLVRSQRRPCRSCPRRTGAVGSARGQARRDPWAAHWRPRRLPTPGSFYSPTRRRAQKEPPAGCRPGAVAGLVALAAVGRAPGQGVERACRGVKPGAHPIVGAGVGERRRSASRDTRNRGEGSITQNRADAIPKFATLACRVGQPSSG